ncbi:MAG: D-alanyl-D-alanine carboxypeptidase [Candidatus Yanofskybacteria bacterium]|nr:D-alanyl-D-alanine carboxypeptidase [Candidatus Yanofskybacteria bacterium]
MRPNVILFTIVLGGLVSGAVFFIFGYPVDVPNTNLAVQPPSEGQQAFLLPVSEISYSPVRDFNVPEPEIEARAAALVDVKSGRFLFAKNINKRLPIASITKLMSAIVVLENLDLNQIFSVPVESINVDGNGADLFKNEQLRVADLFKIMLVKSSNDAALTLATEAQKLGIDFVAKMNEKAQNLGMANSKFTDPAGLDDYDAFSTASDLIKLVSYAKSYELISGTLKATTMDVSSADGRIPHHLVNTNQLLNQIRGIIIGKTGYTDNALGTMVLEVGLDNVGDGLISVVLGSQNRFGETEKLIEWGKTAYSWE